MIKEDPREIMGFCDKPTKKQKKINDNSMRIPE